MILFFQESNGDFLSIDTSTRSFHKDHFEGRATAISGLVGSVCTTVVSRDFLRTKCRRVARAKVPAEWLKAIGV